MDWERRDAQGERSVDSGIEWSCAENVEINSKVKYVEVEKEIGIA